jgi:hypothetical protein
MALSDGKMKLTGVRKPDTRISTTGTLSVKLSGPASSPRLTFVERGLLRAEHRLGFRSPFDAGGHPLVVSIQRVRSLTGC